MSISLRDAEHLAAAIDTISGGLTPWNGSWSYIYMIEVTKSGKGTGTITGAGGYVPNETVTLVATPGTKTVFDGWYENDTKVSSSTTYTFTVTTNRALVAKFLAQYTISVVAGSNGTVSGGGTVNEGGSIQIKATANSGYEFSKWNDGNTTATRTLTNVQADATYTATFKQASCLVAGTLINMPDGTKKPVEEVVNWSELMSWDFDAGQAVATPVTPIEKNIVPEEYDVIYLNFNDGKRIGYVDEHWFFSKDEMKFVEFNRENPESYIGKEFVKIDGNGGWTTNVLESVERITEVTTIYSPVSFKHMNIIADDMLNMAADLKGMFNYFDVDPETMAWYSDKKEQDIETYGLMTMEDMGGELDQDAMDAFSVQYLKVSLGKGLLDWNRIQFYIDRYLPNLYMNE